MSRDVIALEIRPPGGEVHVGAALQLNLFAVGKGGRADLIPGNMAAWSSSDPKVAEVNRQGKLTPGRPGQLTVVARYTNLHTEVVFTVI